MNALALLLQTACLSGCKPLVNKWNTIPAASNRNEDRNLKGGIQLKRQRHKTNRFRKVCVLQKENAGGLFSPWKPCRLAQNLCFNSFWLSNHYIALVLYKWF